MEASCVRDAAAAQGCLPLRTSWLPAWMTASRRRACRLAMLTARAGSGGGPAPPPTSSPSAQSCTRFSVLSIATTPAPPSSAVPAAPHSLCATPAANQFSVAARKAAAASWPALPRGSPSAIALVSTGTPSTQFMPAFAAAIRFAACTLSSAGSSRVPLSMVTPRRCLDGEALVAGAWLLRLSPAAAVGAAVLSIRAPRRTLGPEAT
mmetsp:Transcript_15982/g.41485  ORF Transcript_15982/g.41485 Transcript_15982/m.41485 type:complete len:207 (-) Transcript_15982:1525-2145(-)